MASTSKVIEEKVRFLLLDAGYAGGQRFTPKQLRDAITDALRDIAVKKPIALSQRVIFQLAEGCTQTLPDTHIMYLGPIRNMGADGNTVGSAITSCDLDSMDHAMPSWYMDTASANVIQAMPDPFTPEKFHVYPPQPAADQGYIELNAIPEIAPIVSEDDVLPVRTLFDNAVSFYTAFRVISADSETEANGVLAKSFFTLYLDALGKRTNAPA